jgi:serine/threonine protein kinase
MLTNLGSEFYSEKKIAEGTFGQIYQIESENKKYALKCISLNNNKNL